VSGYRPFIAELAQTPVAGGPGIGHGAEGGEGLGADDEQGFVRFPSAGGFHEIGAVHVGDKTEVQVALAVMLQGRVGHHRAEIRAAQTDIDDVADAFAGVPQPLAAANLVGKSRHPIENHMYFRYNVYAVHKHALALGGTQGGMQHRVLFGHVDFVAVEHGLNACVQAAFLRQGQQKLQAFVGDAVLGVIEINAGRLGSKPCTALRISGE
jgi:hypothetical protein